MTITIDDIRAAREHVRKAIGFVDGFAYLMNQRTHDEVFAPACLLHATKCPAAKLGSGMVIATLDGFNVVIDERIPDGQIRFGMPFPPEAVEPQVLHTTDDGMTWRPS